MGQRYLIVVDDIWNTKAWEDIQDCFPDNMNSSRILMTTRQDEVAKYVDGLGKCTHLMRFLHFEESWKLFSLKMSKKKILNHPEFTPIGQLIVRECQGLPLTIVLVAGLLAKLNESKQWRDVACNVKSFDKVDHSRTCSRVLSLSYSYLPDHLKVCFLYFGVFPEDSDILVGKLAKLWAADGFLKAKKGKSLEEVAMDYLYNLIEKLKFELGRVEHFCLPNSFPQNLKKLTLCKTYLSWEEMDIIGKLPNLEVLKLKDFAFCGPVWKSSVETFHRLKFLLVAHSDLEHWDVDKDVFPVLECLALRCCWYLKELPNAFARNYRLRLIELIDCCPSLVNSAKTIQREIIEIEKSKRLLIRHFLTEDKFPKDESSKEESKYAI